MQRALRPGRIDETVVEVLLNVLNDQLDVQIVVFYELTTIGREAPDLVFMPTADRGGHIAYQEVGNGRFIVGT